MNNIELRFFELIINEDIYDSILKHVNKKSFENIDGYGETVYSFTCEMGEDKYMFIRVHNHTGGYGDLEYPCIVAQLMDNKGSIGQSENDDITKPFIIFHDGVSYGVNLTRNYIV